MLEILLENGGSQTHSVVLRRLEENVPFRSVDLLRVRTYPLPYCQNRVALENLILPERPAPDFHAKDLEETTPGMVEVRRNGCPSTKNAPWNARPSAG